MASNDTSCDLKLGCADIKQALELQFSKKYVLSSYVQHNEKTSKPRNNRCVYKKLGQNLPSTVKWFHEGNKKWTDPKLATMKADLNATKGLLNEKPLKEWHRHTRFRNPAAGVLGRVRAEGGNPELLTQVWQ